MAKVTKTEGIWQHDAAQALKRHAQEIVKLLPEGVAIKLADGEFKLQVARNDYENTKRCVEAAQRDALSEWFRPVV